jgi:hypothetical protein
MLRNIPSAVYREIGSYLLEPSVVTDGNFIFDNISAFMRKESERSWRNFLSARNDQFWKAIRKETMIWNLNQMSFTNYLKNELFRSYMNERMIDPVHQLQCRFSHSVLGFPLNEVNETLVFRVGYICIENYTCDIFPSSEYLHTLILENCRALETLQEFPRLKTLKLTSCRNLTTVGKMDNLQELHLECVERRALQLFPSENIQKFSLSLTDVEVFFELSNRFTCLKELSLRHCYTSVIFRPEPLPLPYLERLQLDNFVSINLTGLSRLKHLNIHGTSYKNILGKETVFPQLKSFAYLCSSFDEETIDCHNLLCDRVKELSLFYHSDIIESFPVPATVNSLTLAIPVQNLEGIGPKRTFRKVVLSSNDYFTDLSMFSNVQMMMLSQSPVEDISPLWNIPYLQLEVLPNVLDFSCLGNQKFLLISNCDHLSDQVISDKFGDICSLTIDTCNEITEIKNLTHNRYLSITSCLSLKRIELAGVDYVNVEVTTCYEISSVVISGKIYFFHFDDHVVKIRGMQNCEYFNRSAS